ncbi:MAG: hypothetical protein O3A36_03795 [bacterium]|nr:hypothetical protein [bacterium]
MKIAIKLNSAVISRSIQVVAKAIGHEIVDDVEVAEAIITTDLRLMLSCLKESKRVVQVLINPSDEPATGLLTAYPERFSTCRVIENKKVDGSEALINFLFKTAPKETK